MIQVFENTFLVVARFLYCHSFRADNLDSFHLLSLYQFIENSIDLNGLDY